MRTVVENGSPNARRYLEFQRLAPQWKSGHLWPRKSTPMMVKRALAQQALKRPLMFGVLQRGMPLASRPKRGFASVLSET